MLECATARRLAGVELIQKYGPAPRPPWRTVDGQFIDARALRAEDVQLDPAGGDVTIMPTQRLADQPWQDQWPTWIGL